MGLWNWLGGIVKPVADLIGEVVEDKDKAAELRAHLHALQIQFAEKGLNYEQEMAKLKANIITAEASGESWLQRNWRPGTMVTFVALVVAKWLGFTAPGIAPEMELQLMSLIQLGLGGYVVGRSVEKIAPVIADAMQKRPQ